MSRIRRIIRVLSQSAPASSPASNPALVASSEREAYTTGGGSASITISSFVVPSGLTNAVIGFGFIAMGSGGPPSLSSATWNSISGTLGASHFDSASSVYAKSGVGIIVPSGAATSDLVVTLDATPSSAIGLIAAVFENVDNAAAEATGMGDSSDPVSCDLTTVTDNALILSVVASFASGVSIPLTLSAAPDQVLVLEEQIAGNQVAGMSYRVGGSAGAHAQGFTTGSAVRVAAVSAAYAKV